MTILWLFQRQYLQSNQCRVNIYCAKRGAQKCAKNGKKFLRQNSGRHRVNRGLFCTTESSALCQKLRKLCILSL